MRSAIYLIKCALSVPSEHRLPKEIWSEKEENLSHLRALGHISYMHIASNEHNKLDAKTKQLFLVGSGDEQFGYTSELEGH